MHLIVGKGVIILKNVYLLGYVFIYNKFQNTGRQFAMLRRRT